MNRETENQLLKLLNTLVEIDESEIDCDEFIHRAGAYVEQLHASGTLSDRFLDEAKHLRICRECREEFEALLSIVQKDG